MIKVYTEWIADFIGKEPSVWTFDGNKLRYRLNSMNRAYANYHPPSKIFGYNKVLMDPLDEANVMTIAVHEAGHYWTIPDRKIDLYFLTMGVMTLLALFNLILISGLIGLVSLTYINWYMKEAEDWAEAFVRDTIGAGMSLNTMMLLVFDSGVKPVMSKDLAKQIKNSLEELEIKYEDSIKS